MTCPTKRKCQRHLANTLKELSHRLVTFETFDQTDEETWHFQNRQWQWQLQLENTLKDQFERLVTFETLITFLTIKNNNLNIHSDPWIESDRDSICNSCDVFLTNCMSSIINFLAFLPNYTWRKFDILCMLETCASLTQAYFALIIWAKHSEEQKIIFFWQYIDTLRIFILSKKNMCQLYKYFLTI